MNTPPIQRFVLFGHLKTRCSGCKCDALASATPPNKSLDTSGGSQWAKSKELRAKTKRFRAAASTPPFDAFFLIAVVYLRRCEYRVRMESSQGCIQSGKTWSLVRRGGDRVLRFLSLTVPDPSHSLDEQRFVITGLSYQQRHLVVVHADRGDRIRIISARLATPSERKKYRNLIIKVTPTCCRNMISRAACAENMPAVSQRVPMS